MESILVALITGICTAFAAWLANRPVRRSVAKIERETHGASRAVADVQSRVANIDTQVTNSHTQNFRDEMTEGFARVNERLDIQGGHLAANTSDTRALKFQVASVQDRLAKHIDRGDE